VGKDDGEAPPTEDPPVKVFSGVDICSLTTKVLVKPPHGDVLVEASHLGSP
jgi:hypothetical protein